MRRTSKICKKVCVEDVLVILQLTLKFVRIWTEQILKRWAWDFYSFFKAKSWRFGVAGSVRKRNILPSDGLFFSPRTSFINLSDALGGKILDFAKNETLKHWGKHIFVLSVTNAGCLYETLRKYISMNEYDIIGYWLNVFAILVPISVPIFIPISQSIYLFVRYHVFL